MECVHELSKKQDSILLQIISLLKDIYDEFLNIISMFFLPAFYFSITDFGFYFTFALVALGLISFITLSVQQLPFLAAMSFIGAVFGAFTFDTTAWFMQSCSFFSGNDKTAFPEFNSHANLENPIN